jgi:hypothetical protein
MIPALPEACTHTAVMSYVKYVVEVEVAESQNFEKTLKCRTHLMTAPAGVRFTSQV